IYFYFSSRRRHTISKRDWSSDVCSSDLVQGETIALRVGHDKYRHGGQRDIEPGICRSQGGFAVKRALERLSQIVVANQTFHIPRSEERRVGKECSITWS